MVWTGYVNNHSKLYQGELLDVKPYWLPLSYARPTAPTGDRATRRTIAIASSASGMFLKTEGMLTLLLLLLYGHYLNPKP